MFSLNVLFSHLLLKMRRTMKRLRRRRAKPMMKAMVIASWHSMSKLVANEERIPHS